ncbi:exonuclease domain-containing protein, partial [uncultured Clostridium sp.]|uniref:exonuclease domain-containing protein n=1 Tax=uncultured Clostridium sp. TaxID=59620 RepID=UPI0025F2F2BF
MKGTIQEVELKSILKNVIFMDIETTGLDSSLNDTVKHKGEIIEIGAVKVLDDKVYTYKTLIRPEGFVPKFTFQLCRGLTMDMLLEAPSLEEVKEEFLEFIGDMPLVCHNAEFEKAFLKYYIKENIDKSNKFLDSMELVAILFPYFKEYNLDYLIKSVTTIDRDEMHRGLEDSIDTIYVVNSILIKYFNSTLDYLAISAWFTEKNRWSWCDYLNPPENINEYMEKVKLKEYTIVEKWSKRDIDYKKYEELLKEGEIFDTPSFKYIFRKGQYNLAKHVRRTLENKKISIIEAPTGIGKSIGYLLPSIVYSYLNNQRVFISSSTKELQDQLIEKDIPRLISTLGLEKKIHYTCMKGRSNYLCNKKIKSYLEDIIEPDLDDILSILFVSRLMTVNGNVEEINFWARKHFKKLEYHLNFLTSDGETCTGRKCNEGTNCYYYCKINELENSNIVVINHSLFLKWPYPEIKIDNIVLDEAHNLNDNCFKAFTEEVSNFEIISLLREIHNTSKNYGFLKDFITKNNLSLANVEYVKAKIVKVYETIDELMVAIRDRYSSVDNFWGINTVFTFKEFQFIVSILENLIIQLDEIYIRIEEVVKETDAK